MFASMDAIVCIKKQIINSVIGLISVKMMNNFLFGKHSANMFFHDESMLAAITVYVAMWVIWRSNKNITMRNFYSSFPCRTLVASKSSLARLRHFYSRFFRRTDAFVRIGNFLFVLLGEFKSFFVLVNTAWHTSSFKFFKFIILIKQQNVKQIINTKGRVLV